MKGRTNLDFVEYVDRVFRNKIIDMYAANNHSISDLDLSSAWAEVQLCVYRNGILADGYDSYEHFSRWCYTTMRRYALWHRSHDKQNRTHRKGSIVFDTLYMSELDDEVLNRTLQRNATLRKSRQTPTMSPSIGWLEEAIEQLTELQKSSIFCLKVAEMSRADAAANLGTTVNGVCQASKAARRKIIKLAPSEYVSLIETRSSSA